MTDLEQRAEKAEAELSACRERVRDVLERYELSSNPVVQELCMAIQEALQAQRQTKPEAICHCGHPLFREHQLPNDSKHYQCPECGRILRKAKEQTKGVKR